MKKVFLFAIAAIAISVASCTNNAPTKADESPKDSLNTEVASDVVVNEVEAVATNSLGDTIAVGEAVQAEVAANK